MARLFLNTPSQKQGSVSNPTGSGNPGPRTRTDYMLKASGNAAYTRPVQQCGPATSGKFCFCFPGRKRGPISQLLPPCSLPPNRPLRRQASKMIFFLESSRMRFVSGSLSTPRAMAPDTELPARPTFSPSTDDPSPVYFSWPSVPRDGDPSPTKTFPLGMKG